jgi:ABC-type nitrate/sulfonate/bicarbonate transport system substrate-binding protein
VIAKRRSYRNFVGAFLCVVVSVAMLAVPANAAQSIKITVPTVTPADAAYFIAAQKGYFAAEGLDVEFVFAGGGTAVPALMSGTVDGSASGAAALSAILRGAPLRVVLVFTESPAYQVWAQPDIHSLADLKGKNVGVNTRGDTFEIAMRLALQAAGIPPDSVGYTPVGFGSQVSAAFDSGALSAAIITSGNVIQMRQLGQFKNAHMIADFYGKVHMPWNAFAMSEKVLYGNPVLAKKMLRAIVKGARYMKVFKSEAIAMTEKYQKDINLSADQADFTEFLSELTPDWTIGNDLVASDLGVRAGLLNVPKDQIPPIAKVYDFGLVRSINAELDASHWKPTR